MLFCLFALSGFISTFATIPFYAKNIWGNYLSTIYAGCLNNGVIYAVSVEGVASLFAGGGTSSTEGSPATVAFLNNPNGIWTDPEGECV